MPVWLITSGLFLILSGGKEPRQLLQWLLLMVGCTETNNILILQSLLPLLGRGSNRVERNSLAIWSLDSKVCMLNINSNKRNSFWRCPAECVCAWVQLMKDFASWLPTNSSHDSRYIFIYTGRRFEITSFIESPHFGKYLLFKSSKTVERTCHIKGWELRSYRQSRRWIHSPFNILVDVS